VTTLIRRAWCAMAGHAQDTVIRWGTVRQTVGRYRMVRLIEERCCRCDRVVAVATARLEGERWVS
jgi:hypothetical protein